MKPSPYSTLNLNHNPFQMETIQTLQKRLAWNFATLETFLAKPWQVYQIIGESGWGKTRFLFGLIGALKQHYPKTQHLILYHRLEEEERAFQCKSPLEYCMLDESQRLGLRDFSKLLKQVAQKEFRLVLATHKNHQQKLKRKKLSYETKIFKPPTPEILAEIVQESLQNAAKRKDSTPQEIPTLHFDTFLPLLEKSHFNLHQTRRFLYEFYVKLDSLETNPIQCWDWQQMQQILEPQKSK